MPSREKFDKMTSGMDDSLPIIIEANDLPKDVYVIEHVGVGGGIQREVRAKYPLAPGSDPYYERWVKGFDQNMWIKEQIEVLNRKYPLSDWSSLPDYRWSEVAESELKSIMGHGPDACVLSEIGPNGLLEILNCAKKRLPLVDGDLAGFRAVPELSISTLNLFDINPCPVVFTSAWGDLVVVQKVLSFQRLEDIARHLAISSGGSVNGAHFIDSERLEKALVRGSISKAISIGRAILDAQNGSNDDMLSALTRSTGGTLLFEGEISLFLHETKDAFHWGEIRVKGKGRYSGHILSIWFKNENHVSWIDNKPFVTSPDLVSIVDEKTGYGLSNAWEQQWFYGKEVFVIGIRAWDGWTTTKGLSIFGPKHFGFDIEYRDLEEAIRLAGI